MKPGIDPKVDYAFKKVFGSESNVDLLTDLLQAVLGFAVSGVELVNPFNDKETSDDKLSILDIKAKDAAGRWFDVEMQMDWHAAIIPRLLYYWAKLYAGQMEEGDSFASLRPAYTICFIDSRLSGLEPDVYVNHFEAVDRTTGAVLTNQFSIHVVELPKFTMTADEIGTPLDEWCYYFRHGGSIDVDAIPRTMDRPPIRKAMEVLMRMSQDAVEKERYESRLKFRRDMQQAEDDRRQAEIDRRQAEIDRQASLATIAAVQASLAATQASLAAAQARALDGFVGQIHLCQRLLKQVPTPKEELASKSLDELQRLAEELQRQIMPGT